MVIGEESSTSTTGLINDSSTAEVKVEAIMVNVIGTKKAAMMWLTIRTIVVKIISNC